MTFTFTSMGGGHQFFHRLSPDIAGCTRRNLFKSMWALHCPRSAHPRNTMPIKGLNDVQLGEILNAHLTPSKEIAEPSRLMGRDHHLLRIARAFNSEGRNIFIFGDRGIGKTSLARWPRPSTTSPRQSTSTCRAGRTLRSAR